MWASRSVILLLSTVMPGLACTCSSYEPAKACAIFHTTPVIFSGRVIDHNDDKTGGFRQITLYRFKVLEIFKGLPSGTKEVFIDPGSMTSCYTTFKSDADYLVYTGYSQPVMAVTVLKNYQPTSNTKQMPAAWKGLERVPIYDVGVCSPTRTIRGNDPDVAFLRSISKYGAVGNGWIEGRALQNIGFLSLFSEYVAASDAKFTVTSRSHESRTATVLPDGIFKIAAVPPGVYEVTAQSPVLGKGRVLGSPGIEVPPGGCALVQASFQTHSTISGRVLNADGKPARNLRLEFGELQTGGKVRDLPGNWANSDEDGNFKLTDVPYGRIVIAVNLNGAPKSGTPYEAFYAPGTHNALAARVFTIKPNSQVTGVTLQLPKPLAFYDLFVDVKWPDGSPALEGARAFASSNGAYADDGLAPAATNRVKLRLALGRKYKIRVDWLNDKPGKFLHVEGETKIIDFNRDGIITELKLNTIRP